MESQYERLKQLTDRLLSDEGFDLVDVLLKGSGTRQLVQVFADREGGITVEDCARLNRLLASIFDRDTVFDCPYRLEVSSPGLDRPLKTERDFRHALGREVEIDFLRGGENAHTAGRIERVDADGLLVQTGRG
ncbi:MAG TPA: ribosome maturation factor RimP, partial [bacterium]